MTDKLSLTTRLTLLFATGSSVVLLALGWLIGAAIERHFEAQDRGVLMGKLLLVQHAVEAVLTPGDLERLPARLSNALVGHHDLLIQVLGPHKEVLLASSDVEFPSGWLARVTHKPVEPLFAWSQNGQSYRGLATAIATGMPQAPPLVVAMAVNTEHHRDFMRTFMQTLWLFVVCAAGLTGVLGWFAARQSLAPLRAMRERAAAVTAQTLDQRLPADAVPAELADLAATLNEMLARLEDVFQRLSDFSSDIAHELRTPISNLMTQTQVALSRARSADDYRSVLESNAEEFEHMARMISDMLLLAKAEHGLVVPHRDTVDLASEVLALFDYYEAVAEEKGLALTLTGHGHISADRLMLRRALGNLLSNAVRHSTPGSTISVHLHDSANTVALEVRNCGEPIAPEFLLRVFDRFFRVDPSRSRSSEGAGLGLAITRSIIWAHGGTIVAASSGGITTFSIRLPKTATRPFPRESGWAPN